MVMGCVRIQGSIKVESSGAFDMIYSAAYLQSVLDYQVISQDGERM
jgi:hypothetical protein